MKKYILIGLACLCIGATAQAQNSKVVSAWNYMSNGELMKAKAAIDEACGDASTSGAPKTWYYKGQVYTQIGFDSALCAKNPGLFPGVLFDAADAFKKAVEVDVKKSFSEKIQGQDFILRNGLYNVAAVNYRNKDYTMAYKAFNKALQIDTLFKLAFNVNRYDTLLHFYTGLSALQSKMYPEASSIFESMMDLNFPTKGAAYKDMGSEIINYLLSIYKQTNDTVKTMAVMQKGIAKYPNDINLLITQLNTYLMQKNYEKAVGTISTAIGLPGCTPDLKKQILFQAGLAYEKMNREDNAEKAYKDAMEIDPKYFDPAYEIGALYFNRGVKVSDSLGKLTDKQLETPKGKGMKERENNIFNNKTLPAMEHALTLATTPADKRLTAQALFKLYDRVGNKVKMKEMEDIENANK